MSDNIQRYEVGQLVIVEPRTWSGINRPGGVGRITKVDYYHGYAESVSVKYIVGAGSDSKIDLEFVRPHEEFLSRTSRARRGREIYTSSPPRRERSSKAPKTISEGTKTTKEKQSRKRHRKVTPSPAPPKERENPEEPQTETKASTSKAKTTVQTSRLGDSSKKQSRTLSTKPPVSVICIDFSKVKVSPLSIPAALSAPSTSGNASRSLESTFCVHEDQYEIVRKLPMPSCTPLNKKQNRRDKMECNNNDKACSTGPSAQQLPMKKGARVPLKRVFENDLGKAQAFVKNVVGVAKKPSSSPAISEDDSTEDKVRQSAFQKSLGHLFKENEDSVSRTALLQHCVTSHSISFTEAQVETYLQALCTQGRIMISDGEIYKI